jgi:cell division protein FtsB
MARWDILELDSLPRERGKLQALLNEHRHARRAARRRRLLLIVLATLAIFGVVGLHLFGGPIALTTTTVAYAVAAIAALVLLSTLPRAVRAMRPARVPTVTTE